MKRSILVIAASLICTVLLGLSMGSLTVSSTTTTQYRDAKVQKITIVFENDWPATTLDDATAYTSHIQGNITGIAYVAVDNAGTEDLDYDIVLKDTIGEPLFSKLDCCSADLGTAMRYAISQQNVDANVIGSVPMSGYAAVDVDGVGLAAEVQTVHAVNDADAGTVAITWNSLTTADIAFDDANTDIEDAMEALAGIGSGEMSITGSFDGANTTPLVFTFTDTLGNVPAMTIVATDSNAGAVTVTETTEGGNNLQTLTIYIFYEQ